MPIAIVGIDVAWGGCDGLDAFEHMLYAGGQHFARVENGRTSIAPSACETLLKKVALGALRDAGLEPGQAAAVAACGSPMARWDWAASFADLGGEANPLVAALDHARRLLAGGSIRAVLFAAGAGPLELPPGMVLDAGDAALGFDREVHGWRLGEGAGAVVLMDADRAEQERRRIYAIIHAAVNVAAGVSVVPADLPAVPSLDDLRATIRSALDEAQADPADVGYVEAFASGWDALDGIEIAALAQAYRRPQQALTTAFGSVQSNLGYLGPAAGLAGLVRAALCLYHRELPGAPGWTAPKLPALWRGAPFYVPVESRAWFHPHTGRGRLAGVSVIGRGGSAAHLLLGEAVTQPVRPNQALAQGGFFLFPIPGENAVDLLDGLAELRHSLAFAASLPDLAAEAHAAACHGLEDAPYAVVIVGHDHEEVLREIDLALKAIPDTFEKGGEWQTPLGSYCTAVPAGREGGVALVYPGAFNSYPGVGKDLFRLFPDLHQRTAQLTSEPGRVIRERQLYPRSLAAISKEELAALEAALLADPIAMLISGTTMALLYTHILEDTFAIRPSAAFGYSLGENSMLYATGVWQQGDAASTRLEQSPAFRERLAGPQMAIREHWGIPADAVLDGPLWTNYLVMAPPEKVVPVLENEPRVLMTHINTPRQVVIGGEPAACKRVLAELRASSIQAPFDYALHCRVMRSEYDALAYLHSWPVEHVPAMRLYSAADHQPLSIAPSDASQSEIAGKIAHMLTSPLDFPRLVQRVYDDGARVFVEAGAGGNCARWISETLKGRTHLALSLNRRGTDDYTTIVRTLARLYSHRVPMDLSALYQPARHQVTA